MAPEYKTPKFFMYDLVEKVWQIAGQNPKGFTITLPDCTPVRSGWCIGHRDTQNSFGKRGLKRVIEHSLRTTKVVGGWKGYNGRYYFDTVMIEASAAKALDLKEEHGQITIYHLDTGRIL